MSREPRAVDTATARLWLGVIFRMYRLMHRRDPDPSGLMDALRELRDGTPLATLVRHAIESGEFAHGFWPIPVTPEDIATMYRDAFGSAPPSLDTPPAALIHDYTAQLLIAAETCAPTAEALRLLPVPATSNVRNRLRACITALAATFRRQPCSVDGVLRIIASQQQTSSLPDKDGSGATAIQPLADILLAFESLGENCEFGLVQRDAGVEPLGLLRFGTINQPYERKLDVLAEAMDRGFAGLGEPGTMTFDLWSQSGPREYFVNDSVYGLRYHSGVFEDTIAESDLMAREMKRLGFLRRKLLEDLRGGEKIWVWKCLTTTSPDQLAPLLTVLRKLGPNILLWVVEADAGHPPGMIEQLAADLVKGYVEHFTPFGEAPPTMPASWHQVCRETHRLVRHAMPCGPA
jgi:hypothetical protein